MASSCPPTLQHLGIVDLVDDEGAYRFTVVILTTGPLASLAHWPSRFYTRLKPYLTVSEVAIHVELQTRLQKQNRDSFFFFSLLSVYKVHLKTSIYL